MNMKIKHKHFERLKMDKQTKMLDDPRISAQVKIEIILVFDPLDLL